MSQLDDVMARRALIRKRAATGRALRSITMAIQQQNAAFRGLLAATAAATESARRFAETRNRVHPRTREPR